MAHERHVFNGHFGVRYRMMGTQVPGIAQLVNHPNEGERIHMHVLTMLLPKDAQDRINNRYFEGYPSPFFSISGEQLPPGANVIQRFKPVRERYAAFRQAVCDVAGDTAIHDITIKRDVALHVMLNFDPDWSFGLEREQMESVYHAPGEIFGHHLLVGMPTFWLLVGGLRWTVTESCSGFAFYDGSAGDVRWWSDGRITAIG